ncbi:MAG: hypothetical protein methR_P3420 [Methyloprofundus sp.]|nr:MAG: hypothetical protein methR_P3420 [Methyloprofundus sp.]
MKISPFFLVGTILTSTLFTSVTNAEMRCQTDSFDNKTCQDSNGITWFGRKDLSGNYLWQDQQGNTIRSETDSFGNTSYRDQSGKLRGLKDSFGNETWKTNAGESIKGRTDSFGNTIYQNGSNSNINCYTDSLNNKTCK